MILSRNFILFFLKFSNFLLLCLFVLSCSKIPEKTDAKGVYVTIISGMKISDAGFLTNNKQTSSLQLYNSGVNVLNLKVSDKVCFAGVCEDELVFNNKFFKQRHYRGLLLDILNKRYINYGKNLQKIDCGFYQKFDTVTYEVCDNIVKFIDTKGVKIIIKDIN